MKKVDVAAELKRLPKTAKARMWRVYFRLMGKTLFVDVGSPSKKVAVEWGKDMVREMLEYKNAVELPKEMQP